MGLSFPAYSEAGRLAIPRRKFSQALGYPKDGFLPHYILDDREITTVENPDRCHPQPC